MSDQLALIEIAPIVPIPRGIVQLARGVFHNLDTGIIFSLHSHPYCCALHVLEGETYMCKRRPGHGGRHKCTTHAKGFWQRIRWAESESHHMTAGKPRVVKPARKLSDATKQNIRRKALVRRFEKNSPLFAEALIADALESNPAYFGPTEQEK